jgi:hypothetical protein
MPTENLFSRSCSVPAACFFNWRNFAKSRGLIFFKNRKWSFFGHLTSPEVREKSRNDQISIFRFRCSQKYRKMIKDL